MMFFRVIQTFSSVPVGLLYDVVSCQSNIQKCSRRAILLYCFVPFKHPQMLQRAVF